jgi:hypothetical protein
MLFLPSMSASKSGLFLELENAGAMRRVDVLRVRQAIDTAQRSLAELPATEEVRRLVSQAEGLHAEVERWAASPPSSDACDRVMRSLMSIHVGAVQLARALRAGRGTVQVGVKK